MSKTLKIVTCKRTKQELDGEIEALTTKIDRAASKSAGLKADVKELQEELAAMSKEQAEMNQIRSEQPKEGALADTTPLLSARAQLGVQEEG